MRESSVGNNRLGFHMARKRGEGYSEREPGVNKMAVISAAGGRGERIWNLPGVPQVIV